MAFGDGGFGGLGFGGVERGGCAWTCAASGFGDGDGVGGGGGSCFLGSGSVGNVDSAGPDGDDFAGRGA